MNWLFGAISYARIHILLSLETRGRALILPQCDVTNFVDSPRKAPTSLRHRWGLGWGEVGEQEEEREGKLGLVCKIKKTVLKKKIKNDKK